jgi:hypothetical protein
MNVSNICCNKLDVGQREIYVGQIVASDLLPRKISALYQPLDSARAVNLPGTATT